MKPSDVPHILWTLSSMELGGTEMYSLQIVPRLMKRVRLTVLLTEGRGGLYDALRGTGVEIIEQRLPGKFNRERIQRARGLIEYLRPDVIHTHSLSTHYLIRVAGILAKSPVIMPHLHGMAEPSFTGDLAFRERRLLPSTDRFLFVSRAVQDDFERIVFQGSHCPEECKKKFEVIQDGLEIRSFSSCPPEEIEALRTAYAIPPGVPVIGKVGRLVPIKNLECLIEVVEELKKSYPEIRCLLVGSGDEGYVSGLRDLCEKKGVSHNVIFTGFRTDTAAHYALMDVAVMTSLSEGLPRMILEAFASGRPVVAAALPGLDEIVEEGRCGYLIKPGNPGAFAARIGELLADPFQREAMGNQARVCVERYDLESYLDRLMEIYARALDSQPVSVHRARRGFRLKYKWLKRI